MSTSTNKNIHCCWGFRNNKVPNHPTMATKTARKTLGASCRSCVGKLLINWTLELGTRPQGWYNQPKCQQQKFVVEISHWMYCNKPLLTNVRVESLEFIINFSCLPFCFLPWHPCGMMFFCQTQQFSLIHEVHGRICCPWHVFVEPVAAEHKFQMTGKWIC